LKQIDSKHGGQGVITTWPPFDTPEVTRMSITDSKAAVAADLERFWAEGTYGHAAAVAQVLERLPNGEYAWLRPESDELADSNPAEPDDALYWPTQSGRDLVAHWRAEEALFGPSPTVVETH
jgi:hypothetical protein